MGGLAVGSWCVRRFLPRVGMRAFVTIQICVGILCFLLPPLFVKMQSSSWSAGGLQTLFSVLGFFVAALLGMEFAIASNLGGRTPAATAAELYHPAIERGLVSRLDHAAYLGRELSRAEHSLISGEPYIQDAAPEECLPPSPIPPLDCSCSPSCREAGA